MEKDVELSRIERIERPDRFGKRLTSIYTVSSEDRACIEGFGEARDLSANYGVGCAGNHPDNKKSQAMVQQSSRVLNSVIAQLFIPQGFGVYTPTVFYKDIQLVLTGPILSLKIVKEKVNFTPKFFIEFREGVLEVQTYLQEESRYGEYRYVPILVDIYNKRTQDSADGITPPIIGICGLGIEVAEARLSRRALEELQGIAQKTTVKNLDDLSELREAINDEKRYERKREAILKALRREYDRLIDET